MTVPDRPGLAVGESPLPSLPRATAVRLLVARLPVDPDLEDAGTPHLAPWVATLVIALGGVVGTLARAALDVVLPHSSQGWPWATLLANVAGSGLIAVLLVFLVERRPLSRVPRPLLGTGLLGGFTTFSTFATDSVEMAHRGRPGLAGAYVVTSVALSLLAAMAGLLAARAAVRLADRRSWHRRVRLAGTLDRRTGGDL